MPFIIMSEPVKARHGAKRRRLAVVEVNPDFDVIPSRIDYRAAGVVRIVEEWNDLYYGKSRSCGFQKAMDEAEELVKRLTVAKAIELKRQRLAKVAP